MTQDGASSLVTRRRFLWTAGLVALALPRSRAWASPPTTHPTHPTPRPGITGEHVLTHAQLADAKDAIPIFDAVREIPQIVDGIHCNCGCPTSPTFYSLLSCFEGDGMAAQCGRCQRRAMLAADLHRAGKSLDQIRAAIDARFG